MLVSTCYFTYTYIGMPFNIGTCLHMHNSGCGSSSTEPSTIRRFALFAYVCGFEGDKNSMSKFEHRWKSVRDYERRRGMDCIKQISESIAEAQADVEREESAASLVRQSELARSSLPNPTVLSE